ncbi:ABC transporter substrate-binding protein [Gordonia sp. ABSL11-1]|uniref:ABC transporter substrate-binding protein n=1 Tax=Gordonia sp. ABSL11-1 TaxID=3053924 RepID=UPI002572EF0F|nr:ABC transporter substrate-binding protein [Gordonia sp. ABSL11-1]MDL9948680.1 ABC transporter substrate-binding protein [Gordonia sp. ABSL11-1]
MRRNLRVVVAAGVAVAALVASGCSSGGSDDAGSSADQGATRTFTAANGTFEIPAKPTRIVALSRVIPSLFTADAAVVGATSGYDTSTIVDDDAISRYKEVATLSTGSAKTNAGGGTQLSYEQIAALKPDLIISGFPQKAYKASISDEQLQAIAPTLSLGPATPTEWREVGEKAADAAGKTDEFDQQKAEYTKLADELKSKYAGTVAGKKFAAFSVFNSTQADSYQREFDDSFTTNVANDIGIAFPGGTPTKTSEIVSIERLSDMADADVIVYQVNPDGSLKYPRMQEVLDSEAWKNLPAVKAGRVVPVAYASSETYAGAIKSLQSLSAGLDKLPAATTGS